MADADLVVVGGGPAGSTLAALVKRRAPRRRVVLLEKAPGPRHHVGESLLPGMVPVLDELGVREKIESAGFPKKVGATFVWGRGRRVWGNDFRKAAVPQLIDRFGRFPFGLDYAWQVRRSRYDEILLAHAEECGVEVRREARAEGLIERGGRVAGVRLAGGERLRSRMLADCSGQDGFLSRFRPVRRYNEALKNVACYSYYHGAKWKYEFVGDALQTKVFICSVPNGWVWYIPIARDIISVGWVTSVAALKARGEKDLRALYARTLAGCREIAPLLKGGAPIQDFDGTGKSFFTHRDWSYLSESAAGPGWLAAGDAAVFVDPILSSGVTLAHLTAHRAAYTLLTDWSGAEDGAQLWADYGRFCRESAAQFLALALFWYQNAADAKKWWKLAAKLQRSWLPVVLGDRSAFLTLSAGLTRHFDRLFSAEHLLDGVPFYAAPLLEGAGDARRVPRLLAPALEELTFVPDPREGRLRPVKRVRFRVHDDADPVRDALNPRALVTRYHLALLSAVDGRRTEAQALEAAGRAGVPRAWLRSSGRAFLRELAVQGVVEFGPRPA